MCFEFNFIGGGANFVEDVVTDTGGRMTESTFAKLGGAFWGRREVVDQRSGVSENEKVCMDVREMKGKVADGRRLPCMSWLQV